MGGNHGSPPRGTGFWLLGKARGSWLSPGIMMENLIHGRFLYVDHLVTADDRRLSGIGAALLKELSAVGFNENCARLVLDTATANLESTPTARHRTALKIAAHARITTEALLERRDRSRASAGTVSLAGQPLSMECGAEGLYPHDLAREIIYAASNRSMATRRDRWVRPQITGTPRRHTRRRSPRRYREI